MTELEQQLLNALDGLQQDYGQRLREWESAFEELRTMFGLTQRENGRLSQQVNTLSQQVSTLSQQVTSLSAQSDGLNGRVRHLSAQLQHLSRY